MFRNRFAENVLTGLMCSCLFVAGVLAGETFRHELPAVVRDREVQVEMPMAKRPVLVFEGYRFQWLDAEKLIIQLEPLPPVVEQGELVAPEPAGGPVT